MTFKRGDVVYPNAAAVAQGFHRTARTLRQFCGTSYQHVKTCVCCGNKIRSGDLYSAKEVTSPLCVDCHEPMED